MTKIRPMTHEERNRAREKELHNMNKDESAAISLVAEMKRLNLTLQEALDAMKEKANDKQFQKDLDETYRNMVVDDWDYWHDGDIK